MYIYIYIYVQTCIQIYVHIYLYVYIYMYTYVAVALSFCVVLLSPPNMCFSVKRSRLQVSFLYCSCSLSFCVAQVFFILCSKVSSYHLLHEKSPIRSPINLNPLNRNLFSQKNPIFNFHLKFLFLCSEVSFIISYMKRARFSLQ